MKERIRLELKNENIDLEKLSNYFRYQINIPKAILKEYQSIGLDLKPNVILLTGATGFLGSFILFDLLSLSPTSTIFCLVRLHKNSNENNNIDINNEEEWRGETEEEREIAFQRILSSLLKYKIVNSNDHEMIGWIRKRVEIVIGDFEHVKFGWSISKWNFMSEKVDLIIHNASFVHSLFPYSKMKNANVTSTKLLLLLSSSSSRLKVCLFHSF